MPEWVTDGGLEDGPAVPPRPGTPGLRGLPAGRARAGDGCLGTTTSEYAEHRCRQPAPAWCSRRRPGGRTLTGGGGWATTPPPSTVSTGLRSTCSGTTPPPACGCGPRVSSGRAVWLRRRGHRADAAAAYHQRSPVLRCGGCRRRPCDDDQRSRRGDRGRPRGTGAGLSVGISFTVETDCRLPDGAALAERRRQPTRRPRPTGTASTAPIPRTWWPRSTAAHGSSDSGCSGRTPRR